MGGNYYLQSGNKNEHQLLNSNNGIQKTVEGYLRCAGRNPKWPINV